jgi:hypothetical protein
MDLEKKTVATVRVPCTEQEIRRQLQGGLEHIKLVESVHFLQCDDALSVWVGLGDDDRAARKAVYAFEDKLSANFPGIRFDFHVVPIPSGQRMEDFISDTQLIFQRSA